MNTHFSGARAPSRQRTRFVQGLLFAILAMVVLSMAPALSAQTEATFAWEAYNDCAGSNGIANTTSITLSGGTTGTPGELLNFASGAGTGVMAQFTATSALSSATSGAPSAVGTDARTTFDSRVSMGGLIYHATTAYDWSADLTLSGLDAEKTYTFAITANRNQSSFINQVTRYSLSGDGAATNASTDGVGIVDDHTVFFSTGYNALTGYVARWTGIEPGDDGTIRITAQNHSDSDNRVAYVCNGFMLAEEVGHVATITTAGTLDAFASRPGVGSAEQTYTVSGSDLTDDIVITAPADFQVSTVSGSGFGTSISLTPVGGAVEDTTVYVRFLRATAGTSTGDISHTSEGATPLNMAVTGTAANEAPTDIALSASTVAENEPAGTTVGDFTTTDPDDGDSHSYELVAGEGDTDNASFAIAGNELQTDEAFDFETKETYTIRVCSTDAGGLAIEKNFTITIADANESPTDIDLSNSTITENVAGNTTIGSFSTTDVDAGDTHTYTLVTGDGSIDNAAFNIAFDRLRISNSPDFETKASYSIRVRTSDASGLTFDEVFTITITNLNEPPTAITLSNDTVAENEPAGVVVGTFSTTDPEGGTHAYILVSGTGSTDNATFTIAGNGVQTKAMFDFETKPSYSIRVRSTDAGGLYFEKTFTITVSDVNEAPTAIALSNNTVAENADSGTAVGAFTTTDPDTGDMHGYGLVAGEGDEDNASFEIVDDELWTAEGLDFETKDACSIRVRSTDLSGLSVEESFTVTVTDVNEVPMAGAGPDQTIEVNQPVTLDGSGSTDPDGNDLIYGWTQMSGPEVALSDVTAVAPTFTAPAERTTFTFSLTVTDTAGLASEPDEVTIDLLEPEIAISQQIDPTSAGPGDTITYSYIITNTGDVALSGVNATDDQLGDLFDEPITLEVDATLSRTLTYVVTENDLPGPLINTVEVAGTSPMGNVVADSTQAAVILTNQPAISVLKEANVTGATVGQVITYTYTVINVGDVSLTGVTAIDDPLGEVTLSATTLLPAESATGTLTYTIAESDLPGPLVNTVIATGTPPAGDDVTASDSVSLPLIAAEQPALEASLVASPDVVRPGEIVAYGLTITNTGNVTLAGLDSVVSVPGGFDLPDSLLPGQSVTVSYSYTVLTSDLPGLLANEVTVMATSPGEQLVTVTVTAMTDVEPYRLFLPLVVKF